MRISTSLATLGRAVQQGELRTVVHDRLFAGRRRLQGSPDAVEENWSARRINQLHAALPWMRSYLEIGLAEGHTFENVYLPIRVGVDPRPRFDTEHLPEGAEVFATTSDRFFATNERRFDLVFVDGLHTFEQTYRDLVNAFQVCPSGGVLVDDVVPSDGVSAMRDLERSMAERERRGLPGSPWHGDVYRMVLCLVEHHYELEFRTIVGSGNPQLLAWKPDPERVTSPVSNGVLLTYASASFEEVFSQGVPASFRPSSEDEALTQAVAALKARYGDAEA